jgi:hypothetical protein
MDVEAAHQARREKETSARNKKQFQEDLENVVLIFLIMLLIVGSIWGTYEVIQYCKYIQCG